MVSLKHALTLAFCLAVLGCEEKHANGKAVGTESEHGSKRLVRRNAGQLLPPPRQSHAAFQRDLADAVRRAFKPRHKCIFVLCRSLVEAPLTRIVSAAPLPVVICQQEPDRASECGVLAADLQCRGILVMAEAFSEAAGAAVALGVRLSPSRGPVTGLGSSQSVFLVTAGPAPRPDGNGIQELGKANVALFLWPSRQCWRLTEPYKFPRFWELDRGLPDVEEERQRYDFNGRNLRVAAFHQPPLVYIEDPANLTNVYGTEWAVLELIAEHLNFTWSVVLSDKRDHFGKPQGNWSWKGGALGAVFNDEADLSLNVWVQLDQSRVVDFTSPTRISCITFMVPRPHSLASASDAVLQPLQKAVWEAWLLSIFVAALASRALDYAARRIGVVTARGFGSVAHSFQALLGVAVVAYVPPSRASLGPQRHLLAWWVMYSVLMTTAFSSGLIAHLTMQVFEQPINTAKDIVDHHLTWASSFVPNFHVMMNLENASEKTLADGMEVIDPPAWEPTVASGKYVVQGQKMDTFYFFWVGGNLGAKTLKKMRLMRSCLANYPVAIALQKDSPFLVPFSKVISRIVEAGLVGYWQRIVVRRKGRLAVQSLFIDAVSREGPLALKPSQLYSAFLVLIYGLLISVAAFFLECIVQSPVKRIKTN